MLWMLESVCSEFGSSMFEEMYLFLLWYSDENAMVWVMGILCVSKGSSYLCWIDIKEQ